MARAQGVCVELPRTRALLARTLPALSLGLAFALVMSSPQPPPPEPVPRAPTPCFGVEGVRQHLAAVESRLRADPRPELAPDQRARRAANLDRLRAYWEAGVFPINDGVSEGPLPIFIDDYDTPCAVGHLMIESGREELARTVAARENYDAVVDIDTPGVAGWLEQQGLTLAEAAMIQPAYGDWCGPDCYTNQCYCGAGYTQTKDYPSEDDAYEGPCRCDLCPSNGDWSDDEPWVPVEVCGEDGRTYENYCEAYLCAGVEVAHTYPCRDDDDDDDDEDDDVQLVDRSYYSCRVDAPDGGGRTLWALGALLLLARRRRVARTG